ncbi:alpha/beta hydrolase [Legionella sp.]|uniref:alpha/beta hydrolase n=1 Tax=Legionella sp. TaxID=459 RepID=UPI003CAB5E6A
MNKNDFRYMRRGKQLFDLKKNDFSLIKSINQYRRKIDRAVVLLHGFSSSPAVYRYLIPQLKNYDAIICPALPGHGASIESFAQATAADWLALTREVCDQLFKKYTKVDIVGLSLGGLIACKLNEYFAFNHMFLLAPALELNMNVNVYLKLVIMLHHLGFKEIRGAAGNLVTDKYAEISYKKLPLTAVIELFNLVLHHQWIAPKVPVDLFLGVHDNVVSSAKVGQLFANLANVSIHWLKNSAHVLALDNDLNYIVNCINNTV